MTAVLQGFSLIAVVVGVGWLVAHTGLLGKAEQQMLATLTFRVGSPALLFLIIADADVRVVFSGFLVATLAAVVVTAAAYLLLARLVWSRTWTHTLMGGMAVTYVNANNLGVPIAIYVLGDAGWAAPILLLQLVLLQPAWLTALDASGGGRVSVGRVLRAPLTNPLTIGSMLGLTVNLLGIPLPPLVRDPVEIISGLAIPCMLIAFGISLRLSPVPGRGGRTELLVTALLKLVVMPTVAVLVAGPLLGLDRQQVLAAGVLGALPTAQNVFILAVAYGRGVQVAREAVFITTMMAMPAMLAVVAVLT